MERIHFAILAGDIFMNIHVKLFLILTSDLGGGVI